MTKYCGVQFPPNLMIFMNNSRYLEVTLKIYIFNVLCKVAAVGECKRSGKLQISKVSEKCTTN